MVARLKILISLLAVCVIAAFTLAMTNYPNGVASYGIPLPAGDYITSGKYLFVDNTSSNAQDSYPTYGTSWEQPLRTIDYALSRCTASEGDIVFVAPYHSETLSSEGGISRFQTGARLVGLGQGNGRPLITFNRARASIIVPSSDVSIENFRFTVSGVSLVSTGAYLDDGKQVRTGVSISDDASRFTFRNNRFVAGNGVSRFGVPLYLSGGTNSVIDGNEFLAEMDERQTLHGVSTFVALAPRVDGVAITNNRFTGVVYNGGTNLGGMISGASLVMTGGQQTGVSNLYIGNNVFYCATLGTSPFWFPCAATVATGATVQGVAFNNYSYSSLSGNSIITLPVQSYQRQP